MKRTRERGQVLVLFVGGMFGLLAIAALAIDLSSVYSTQQTEKAATDAAALAGAQQLPIVGTPDAATQKSARDDAWATLQGRFGLSGLPCDTTKDNIDCPLSGTSYHASISTPAKTTPTNQQSLQVTLTYPNFQLSFSRLLGQNGWNVWRASVAVDDRKHSYALMTLQPPQPKPNGTDANLCKNLVVSGNNTVLNVLRGDIGTNTSARTTLAGLIALAPGYVIDHVDDITLGGCSYTTPNATWSQDLSGNPPGNHIGPSPLLQDPSYPIAKFTNATSYTQASGGFTCPAAGSPGFPDAATVTKWLTPPSGGVLTCYHPGIYTDKFSLTSNKDIAYLMPGAYEFTAAPVGMKLGGTLAGGLVDAQPGVVLVFPQTTTLDPNNTVGMILNMGSSTCAADGCQATPAVDFSGTTPATSTPIKTTENLTITIEVPRDEGCFSGTNPVLDTCSVTTNTTVGLAGSGVLEVSGVIYAPSDNMNINGGSAQTGVVGQIISWTVTYTGGSTLNQSYPINLGKGIVRLDKACSGGDTPCSP
jgi:Putative Flp pilus-assembly TadE/G-like